jgi:hypothetical protein
MGWDRIDLDRLAEAYYAKYDPQYEEECELEEEKERFEARTMTVVETGIKKLLDLLSDSERDVLRENFNALCDFIDEALED